MNFKRDLGALAGALVGGVLAYFAFDWVYRQGFYAGILPGVFIGLGSVFAKSRNSAVPVLCALGALFLGAYLEWERSPFVVDDSFGYFLQNLHKLDRPVKLIMILAGSLLAFWIPFRRSGRRLH